MSDSAILLVHPVKTPDHSDYHSFVSDLHGCLTVMQVLNELGH